jgi:hypothetical protein
VRTLAGRIGLNRVAAILVGCALVLEILRVKVVSGDAAVAACSLGEVLFLVLAVAAVVSARRRPRR